MGATAHPMSMPKTLQRSLLSLVIAASPAWSSVRTCEYGYLTDLPFEQLVQLEVQSASSLARAVSDAPSAIAVVTAQDIKDFGYRSLADILNSMRGLYTTHDHAFEYLGGRGFSRPGDYAGRVLLLIDGYASNDNLYNQIYIDDSGLLDVELIERVEYVPGTGSVLYGNNAYFGVISVTTKKGRDLDGTQIAAELFSQGGRKARASFGKQLENGADVLLSVSRLDSDGEKQLDIPGWGVVNNLDYQESTRFFGKLHYDRLTLEAAYVDWQKAVPTGLGNVPLNNLNLFRDSNAFISARFDTHLSPQLKSSTHAYTGYYLDHGIYELSPTEHAFNRGQWWGLDQTFAYTGISGQRLVGGAGYRDDFRFDLNNSKAPSSRHERQTLSVFVQDEITLSPHWLVNAGIRYDHASDVGGHVSPRLAVIHQMTPQTTLKLGFSNAFRLPAAFEKYNVGSPNSQIANPDLQPENIATTELVLHHEHSTDLSFTASLYRYQTEDLIGMAAVGVNNQFVNLGESRTNGLELEVDRSWRQGTRLRASYAFQDAQDTQGQEAINAPRHLAKLNVSTPVFNACTHAGLEVQHVGSRLSKSRSEQAGYTLVNLTLTANRLLPDFTLSASLRNLFDQQYVAVAPDGIAADVLPMDGINFWVAARYTFR